MTTTPMPSVLDEQANTVLLIFRESKIPLTIAQARSRYNGPKFRDKDWPGIIEEHLLQGNLFECFPKGRVRRFWGFDEKNRIRAEIERELSGRVLGQKALTENV